MYASTHHGIVNILPVQSLAAKWKRLRKTDVPFDYYGDDAVVAFQTTRRAKSLGSSLYFGEPGERRKVVFTHYYPMSVTLYLQGILALYGSVRGRRRLMELSKQDQRPAALTAIDWARLRYDLDTVVAECRLSDQDAIGFTHYEQLPYEKFWDESFDEGSGPSLDDTVLVTTPAEAWQATGEWFEDFSEEESARAMNWTLVAGPRDQLAAIVQQFPNDDPKPGFQYAEPGREYPVQPALPNLKNFWRRFLVTGRHRPDVRFQEESDVDVLTNATPEQVTRFLESVGTRVVSLDQVGVREFADCIPVFQPANGLTVHTN